MKKRIRLLSILLSLSLGISGCSNNMQNRSSVEKYENGEINLEEFFIDQDIKSDEVINEDRIQVNPQVVNHYLDYFNSISYTYKGEEFYLSDEEIDNLIDVGNTVKIVNHEGISTDAYTTFDMIKANTNTLIAEQKDLHSCFYDINNPQSESEFQNAFNIALFHILKSIPLNETNDINEDFCKFQSLSICYGDVNKILGTDSDKLNILGYYNDKLNAIILDINGIYELYGILFADYEYRGGNYASLVDIIMVTLCHELNHVRQFSCDCRIDAGQEYFTIGDYTESIPTIIESSAESSIYNVQDYISEYVMDDYSSGYFYPDERKLECFILLLGLLNNDANDYYNAIYDSNLNELYEFTGCTNREDIKRLYHILYNMDGLMLRNNLASDIEGNASYLDIGILVGNEFAYEVLNIFTEDLIEYISTHEDMSSIDAMSLFVMAESLCLSNTSYIECDENGCEQEKYDKDLVSKINDTRINFENFIKDYYGLTDDEVYLVVLHATLVISCKDNIDMDSEMEEDFGEYRRSYTSLVERFPLIKSIADGSDVSSLTYKYIYSYNNIDYNVR